MGETNSLFENLFGNALIAEEKSPRQIAEGIVAEGKAAIYNNLTIARVDVSHLYENTIDKDGNEVSVLAAPERQYFTIHLRGGKVAAIIKGERIMSSYIFASLYEVLGVLKNSPMAAFVDAVAKQPALAAILLPGAAIDVCAEVIEAGTSYTNPFGKSNNMTLVKELSVFHHILSLGISPAAKAAMAAQAEKLAQF